MHTSIIVQLLARRWLRSEKVQSSVCQVPGANKRRPFPIPDQLPKMQEVVDEESAIEVRHGGLVTSEWYSVADYVIWNVAM
jgi:hypothetical protein